MSEFKGTKGPWSLKQGKRKSKISGGNWINLAKVWTHAKHYGEKEYKEREDGKANALLISKAPEMLEMLKSFVNDFDSGLIEDFQIPRDRFEKLIKEATEL